MTRRRRRMHADGRRQWRTSAVGRAGDVDAVIAAAAGRLTEHPMTGSAHVRWRPPPIPIEPGAQPKCPVRVAHGVGAGRRDDATVARLLWTRASSMRACAPGQQRGPNGGIDSAPCSSTTRRGSEACRWAPARWAAPRRRPDRTAPAGRGAQRVRRDARSGTVPGAAAGAGRPNLAVGPHQLTDRKRRLDRPPGKLVAERDVVGPGASTAR